MARLSTDLRVLTDEEARSIHREALVILEKVGIRIEHKRMLDCLAEVGARVDYKKSIARFPEELVESCLKTQVEKANKEDNQLYADPWNLGNAKFISEEHEKLKLNMHIFCVNILDYKNDTVRSATLDDLKDSVLVGNTIEALCELAPLVVPGDVPSCVNDAYMWHTLLKWSDKRVSGEIFNIDTIPYILEMCYLRTGGKEGFARDPWINYPCFYTGAFEYSEEALDIGFAVHDMGVPVRFGSTMGVAGMNSPTTLAGALTAATAEGLAGFVMAEAVGGNSIGYLGSAISFNQGNGTALYESPEKELMAYAVRDLARIYGFKHWRVFGGHSCASDSCWPGIQAGVEKGFSTLFAAMANTISVHCGMLSPELASIPQMLIDEEIVQLIDRFMEGIEVNEITIAGNLIQELGIQGNYLDAGNETAINFAVEHFRKENWLPKLFVRERPVQWQTTRHELYQNAKNKTCEILNSPAVSPLDEATEREMDKILKDCVNKIDNQA